MANIKTLKDYNNGKIYPQTVASAVYLEGNKQLDVALKERITQFLILPDAAQNYGQIVQYVGETNEIYVNGFFYQSNGTEWVEKSTQTPGGVQAFNGRGGEVEPQEGDYTAGMVGAVSKAGDTMTGPLNLAGDPTSGLQAATKQYVDKNGGKIQSVSVHGEAQTILDKNIDLLVPMSTDVAKIVIISEENYAALVNKDPSTLYLFKEEE